MKSRDGVKVKLSENIGSPFYYNSICLPLDEFMKCNIPSCEYVLCRFSFKGSRCPSSNLK